MTEYLFPSFILVVAAGLIAAHVRTWRRVRGLGLPPAEADFHWRQCRRRVQTSGMLAVLAVVLFAWPWIEAPLVQILLALAALVLVVWIGLLAVTDVILARHHYQRLQSECVVEEARLQMEARRLRGLAGNGRADDDPLGPAK